MMNPNLRLFLKGSVYFLGFAGLIGILVYTIPGAILATIGSYAMYGFMGLVMLLMGGLILGVVLRTVWTGIMNRTDSIVKCCADKRQDGIHLVCSHYNPGGESTEGFSSYFHYYIDRKGTLYLSKKVEKEGNDLAKSLQHLSDQTRLQFDPDLKQSKRIGSYTDGESNPTETTVQIRNGELYFKGYEGLIDYGFKVRFLVEGKTLWRVRI
jgi:hypothetical protein